ncbi:hypothetical protein I9Y31_003025 [Clostridium perfringens]|nr:hypothetical protein [Clostridium perfringens]
MALIVAFIAMIYIVVILCLDCMTRVRHRNECEEECEDDEWDMIQKAIIILGNEKIEIEVDYYEINRNIIKIKGKDGDKTELKLFCNWKYESEDILNFFINKELQSIEYKKNGNSILIPISEVKSYEFRVEERSNEYESFRKA